MIKIQCPSCAASYELDEKRMPSVGLNMRCPQCTEVFRVHADGSVGGEVEQRAPKQTQTGVGPSSRPPKKTEMGVGISAPPPAPVPEIPPVDEGAIPEPISLPPLDDFEDILTDPEQPGMGADEIDLPMPKEEVDLPAPRLGTDEEILDLPTPLGDEIDLPMARSDADLPALLEDKVDLPLPKADFDLPGAIADFGADEEQPGSTSLDDLFPGAGGTPPPASPEAHSGELPPIVGDEVADDLLMPASEDLGLDLELDDFRQPEGGGAGGTADLPDLGVPDIQPDFLPQAEADIPLRGGPTADPSASPELDMALGEEADDLEFSDLPEAGAGATAGSIVDALAGPKEKKGRRRFRLPYWVERALPVFVILAILIAVGYSLKETKYGMFGRFWFERFLPSAGDDEHVAQVISHAEEIAVFDTYGGIREGTALLERLRRTSGLNRRLLARSLLHESMFQIRFGEDPESAGRADEIRATLESRGSEAPGIEAAFAADLLRRDQIGGAMAAVQRARVESPADPYVELVAGEVALLNSDPLTAIAAFQAALKKHGGARAQWGLARAYRANGDLEKAASAEEETVTLSQHHIAARTAVAKRWLREGKIEAAHALLLEPAGLKLVDGQELPAAAKERSQALRVLGDVEQRRGRRGAAREAYSKSSSLNPKNLEANYGLATMLLADGNYKDAFTRFQALMSAGLEEEEPPPEGQGEEGAAPKKVLEERPLFLRAKLGAAEALLGMALSQQADTVLRGIEQKYPNDPLVAFWVAETSAARNRDDKAIKYYKKAIEIDPAAFRPYIGLSQHLARTGNPREALSVLAKASKYVPMTAEVRRLRGQAQLAQGEVTAAIGEFEAALRMEPENLAVRFELARGLRLAGRLTDATQVLSSIERVDPTYPGLAVEKGLISEANKDTSAAVSHYRAALESNPNDFDLKVRLSAALLATENFDAAEAILEEARKEKPYSHEVLHYLGRLEFARGRYPRARQHFQKAARLDRNNATYRLYEGWLSLETNELANALRQIELAIELDPKLGDAYWLRARIRIRTGAVEDALRDLDRALKLNPDRNEAFAAKAECQSQLGRFGEAAKSYKEALARDPNNGRWWYRLGRVELDRGQRAAGYDAVDRAAKLGAAMQEPPRWLADTQLLLGEKFDQKGDKTQAAVHYRRYLELAPEGAIDRPEVEKRLEAIGPVKTSPTEGSNESEDSTGGLKGLFGL